MCQSLGEYLKVPAEFILASSPLFNFVTRKQDLRPAASGGALSAAAPVSGQVVHAPNRNNTCLLMIILIPNNWKKGFCARIFHGSTSSQCPVVRKRQLTRQSSIPLRKELSWVYGFSQHRR